jgi:Bacterial mobilisation protein (MobC)
VSLALQLLGLLFWFLLIVYSLDLLRMPAESHSDYMKSFRATQRAQGVRRVSVTLSSEEYERLIAHANKHEAPPTAHLKQLAFSYLDKTYLVPSDITARLQAVTAILRGIGNNLNQLARHSNEMKAFMDTNEVRLQLRRMEAEVKSFVTKPVGVIQVAADQKASSSL